MAESGALLPPDVLPHIVDAHCHPTNATDEEMAGVTSRMCIMSMHQEDQKQVEVLAEKYPTKVIPFFGQLL
jgi:Tat protein secretion system quality control protein TatD with DNase activity